MHEESGGFKVTVGDVAFRVVACGQVCVDIQGPFETPDSGVNVLQVGQPYSTTSRPQCIDKANEGWAPWDKLGN